MPKPRRGDVFRVTLSERERTVVVVSADMLNIARETAIVALVLVEMLALELPTVATIPEGEDIAGQIRLDTLWVLPSSELTPDNRICALSEVAMNAIARPLMATFDLVQPPLT